MMEWPEERALILQQDAVAELDATGRAYAEALLFAIQDGIDRFAYARAMLAPLIPAYNHYLICDLADAIKAAPFTDLERRGQLYGGLQMAQVLLWSEAHMHEAWVYPPDVPHL